MQFPGHHSYFRTYFQMLLAVKEGERQPSYRALGHIWQQESNDKNMKNIDLLTVIHCVPCKSLRTKKLFTFFDLHIFSINGFNRFPHDDACFSISVRPGSPGKDFCLTGECCDDGQRMETIIT